MYSIQGLKTVGNSLPRGLNRVLKKYGSLYNLLKELDKNQCCLDNLKYESKSGEMRRISKTSIRNIVQYLLYQKSNVIKIAT